MEKYILRILALACLALLAVDFSYAQVSQGQNYVITNVLDRPRIKTVEQASGLPLIPTSRHQTVRYFDGLGRPVQTNETKCSPGGWDIITPVDYDSFGREVRAYLPYADSAGGNGTYRSTSSTDQGAFYLGGLAHVDTSHAPYSLKVLESSPLNRLLAEGGVGTSRQPNPSDPYDATKHVRKFTYGISSAVDSVRIFLVDSTGGISASGFYPASALTVVTTSDENNHVVKEFTDKLGHLLLRRVYLAADSLQTYFVYDDYDMLRAVLQPEGVASITGSTWTPPSGFVNKWAFLYRYDTRKQPPVKLENGEQLVRGDGRSLLLHVYKLFTDYKRELNSHIFSQQLLADQYRGLVVGYPDKGYRMVDVPGNPVGQLVKTAAGRAQIEKMLEEKIKPLLKEGALLLNTNLPAEMLNRLGITARPTEFGQKTALTQNRPKRQRIQ